MSWKLNRLNKCFEIGLDNYRNQKNDESVVTQKKINYNMSKKAEGKKFKVKFSKEASDSYMFLPDDVLEDFDKIIKGLKNGTINPEKIGKPVKWVELDMKLKCPKCKSSNVEWLLDKNSDEVDFCCLKCGEAFWMTNKDYKTAVEKNSDCII